MSLKNGSASSGLLLLVAAGCVSGPAEPLRHFVRRDGDRLMDGPQEYRFISVNIPNLHYVEDDMRFSESMPFRLPDDYEINDALESVAQIGGQVVRTYALSVRREDDPPGLPRHILAPDSLNEDAFRVLDQVLATARRHQVRVILPFVDQWSWWGGHAELAGFRGRPPQKWWTDAQLIEDYKQIIARVINRRNTLTGVAYRDDTAILAWETGNELKAPASWTSQVAAFIKSIDPNHLVIDGATYDTIPEDRLEDPHVDFVQTHHYEKDPRQMLARIRRNAGRARGHRPYHVGEFGFLGTEALGAVMDTVIRERMSGALLWSLRYRSRDGGFYWHHEPYGGDFFKAYHWPGFEISEAYDERGMMRLLRSKAYEIRGLTAPPLAAPGPPRLLAVGAGGSVTWRGPAGAACHDVERAESAAGPWSTVGTGVSDAQVQYQPAFVDESAQPGRSYYYRVTARNQDGRSAPSNPVGPVRITHRTLVDELWNDSRIFLKQGALQFRQNDARKTKEDCHRLSGAPGSAIVYRTREAIGAIRLFVYSPPPAAGSGPAGDTEPAPATTGPRPAGDTGASDLRVSFSADGAQFKPVEPLVTRTSTHGEKVYGFWKADLYAATPGAPGCRYVMIEFRSGAQLGRVEVEYGSVVR